MSKKHRPDRWRRPAALRAVPTSRTLPPPDCAVACLAPAQTLPQLQAEHAALTLAVVRVDALGGWVVFAVPGPPPADGNPPDLARGVIVAGAAIDEEHPNAVSLPEAAARTLAFLAARARQDYVYGNPMALGLLIGWTNTEIQDPVVPEAPAAPLEAP